MTARWKSDIKDAPRDGTPINVRFVQTVRFMPYKPNSEQRKRGIYGRWQKANEYGGWDRCEDPTGLEWSEIEQ